jgi:hypothetical protein
MATSLRDWLSGMVSPWFDESSVPSSVEKKTTTPITVSLGGKEAGGETSELGQNRKSSMRAYDFRYTPVNGHRPGAAEDRGPLMHAHVGMMLALHGAKPIGATVTDSFPDAA